MGSQDINRCTCQTGRNTWVTLAMSTTFGVFFVWWHCQDVCVTHTKAGTKRWRPTSMLDICVCPLVEQPWQSIMFAGRGVSVGGQLPYYHKLLHMIVTALCRKVQCLFRQSDRLYHPSSAARSGFALVLCWELSLHAKTWLANTLFSWIVANTSLIT